MKKILKIVAIFMSALLVLHSAFFLTAKHGWRLLGFDRCENPDVLCIETVYVTDKRTNGTQYGYSCWDYGKCEEYDIETEKQMSKTISDLVPKIDILNQIKNKFNVEFYIQIVPVVYSKNSAPCLGPNLDIIDFCYKTRTLIDIDLYVMS